MTKPELTQERLKELLHYDPETGRFTRKTDAMGGHRRQQVVARAGDVLGTKTVYGYSVIWLDKKLHLAHRLACLYMNGEWPKLCIDHIDGDKLNNSWANLREVGAKVNGQNIRGARINNKSGFLGVHFQANRYRADIKVNGKTKYLGRFKTPEEAHAAYVEAKRRLHEGCTI